MTGTWDVAYADDLSVRIEIGGAVYTEELGAEGGTLPTTHEGRPLMFDLDCSRDEVVCPSEVWPMSVRFRRDDEMFPHRVWMQVPRSECIGTLAEPEPAACGEGTSNPDCEQVCEGEVVTGHAEAFGTIDEPGEHFTVGLGAGVASNGVNCVLLGISVAEGDLVSKQALRKRSAWLCGLDAPEARVLG